MPLFRTLAACALSAASLALPMLASALSPAELDRLGGRLQAQIDGNTYVLPSLRTDIDADVRGDLVTVTIEQRFDNPFDEPMHAVYLFPLNKDAAVFEMTMEVGDERIRAQIDRVEKAKKTFKKAKAEGKSAALLEQHRPNMFTQKIANLVPGLPIDVTLRYVHTVAKVDGDYELVLPLVVGPRFQPPGAGDPDGDTDLDAPGPTRFERFTVPDEDDPVQAGAEHAIDRRWNELAKDRYWGGGLIRVNATTDIAQQPVRMWKVQARENAEHAGSAPDSTAPYAQWELEALPAYPPVAGLELPASITAERVGLNVSIHAQVPVQAVESRTHGISTETLSDNEWNVQLARGRTIDNRDFVLRYRLAGVQTQAGALAHRDERGGFFSALIEPPAVPAESEITPREVVFVLDASGSMSGLPMEASKAFMRAALGG
ncbi:MAG: VIT domain-containing protein, partial [Gammaproteobacteria bacterium]